MARTSKVDSCLICDCVPCECNAARKASKPVAKKAKASPVEAMKARVKNPEPIRALVAEVENDTPVFITEDDEFRMALFALAPILHHDELMKYRMILGGKPDKRFLSTRAAEWRLRNHVENDT